MKKLMVFACALMCAVVLAGCAGGTLEGSSDESGAYNVTASNAEKGAAVSTMGGGVEVAKGQVLVISPKLEKGSFQVKLLDDKGEVALEEAAGGTTILSRELDPGDYSINVTSNENGTTGTLLVVAVDLEELESQNQDVEALLDQMGSASDSSASAQK